MKDEEIRGRYCSEDDEKGKSKSEGEELMEMYN